MNVSIVTLFNEKAEPVTRRTSPLAFAVRKKVAGSQFANSGSANSITGQCVECDCNFVTLSNVIPCQIWIWVGASAGTSPATGNLKPKKDYSGLINTNRVEAEKFPRARARIGVGNAQHGCDVEQGIKHHQVWRCS